MENWKSINGHERYEISDLGNIASLPKTGPGGHSDRKIMKPFVTKFGYSLIDLCKDGKINRFLVHRLVAAAFLTNEKKCREVNHKNGIKTDNRVENLEWCTPSENKIHAFKTGLMKSNTSLLVIDESTGIFYESIKEAAKSKNIGYTILKNMMSGLTKNRSTFKLC